MVASRAGSFAPPSGDGNAYHPRVRVVPACVFVAACGFHAPASNSGPGDATPGDSAGGEPGTPAVDASMIDAPPDAPSCPTGFVTVVAAGTGSRYQVFPKASQLTALTSCGNLNTHLLHLDTQAEATALEDYINTQTSSGDTGLYRVVGARDPFVRTIWHDLDLRPMMFLPWGAGEPTDQFGEDCMLLKREGSSGVTGADQCGTAHEFACECD